MNLTEQVRDQIEDKVKKDKFARKQAKFAEAENILANEAIDAGLGQYKKAWECLPQDWLEHDESVQVRGGRLSMKRRALPGPWRWTDDMPVTDEFMERVRIFFRIKDAFCAHKTETMKNLRSLLRTVRTTKQLLAIWPKGKQYIPTDDKALLPAPLALNLDRMLEQV